MVGALRRAMSMAAAGLENVLEGRTEEGSAALLAVSKASARVGRHYFSQFGQGQLFAYTKDLCIFFVRRFLSQAATVKPCMEDVRVALTQDMQAVETALSAIDVEFQSHIRHEAAVFREFRRLLCNPSIEAVDFVAVANVMPLRLLLTHLVHRLPDATPSLAAFSGVSNSTFVERTLMPLWEDPDGSGIAAFKSLVANLCDRHELDPTESTVVAFVMSQS